jgi:hypothetical protein
MTSTKTEKQIITITDENIIKLIEERQSYRNLLDEIRTTLEEMDKRIIIAVEESGSHSIVAGTHKVTLSKYTKESVSAKDVKSIVSDEVFEHIVNRNTVTRLIVK